MPQEEFRDPVRALRERVRDDLDDVTGILLFESVARGETDRQSDIDCFILVSDNRATIQRRAHELAQKLGERRFDGDRYVFQILVESAESANRQADRLTEIFGDGLMYDTGPLSALKTEVLAG